MRPPPPKGPTPLFHPLHEPPPQCDPPRRSRDRRPPALFISMTMTMMAKMTHGLIPDPGPAFRRGHRYAGERDAAALRDPSDDARDACEQPWAVLASREIRRHVVTADLAGIPVSDELLEVVADFGPHSAILHRQQHEQAVVLALVADAAAAILEHLHRVLADIGVEARTCRSSQPPRHPQTPFSARGCAARVQLRRRIDDVGEIVDRPWSARASVAERRQVQWVRGGATRASTISAMRDAPRSPNPQSLIPNPS